MESVSNKPTYRDQVYKFLINAIPGKRYEISALAKLETQDQFVQVLKDFIAYRDCEVWGFDIEFTSDYKGFVKLPKRVPLDASESVSGVVPLPGEESVS